MKIVKIICLALFVLLGVEAFAQTATRIPLEVVSTSGLIDNDAPKSHTFSIGEVLTSTVTVGDTHWTQGYLQPQVDGPCATYQIIFYPNPTKRYVYLDVLNCDAKVDYVEIYDAFGKEVKVSGLDSQGKIDLEHFGVGVYFLRAYVVQGNFSKTLKIVKVAK